MIDKYYVTPKQHERAEQMILAVTDIMTPEQLAAVEAERDELTADRLRVAICTARVVLSGMDNLLCAAARQAAGEELGRAVPTLSTTIRWQFNQALHLLDENLPVNDPARAVIKGIWKGMEKSKENDE